MVRIPTMHTSHTACLNFALRISPLHSRFLHNLQILLLLNLPHLLHLPTIVRHWWSMSPRPSLNHSARFLSPPETEQCAVRLPEGITGEELDVINLTAQFVTRIGKSFWTELTGREVNTPTVPFLKLSMDGSPSS